MQLTRRMDKQTSSLLLLLFIVLLWHVGTVKGYRMNLFNGVRKGMNLSEY